MFKKVLLSILTVFITTFGYSQSSKSKISIKNDKWEKGGFFEGYTPQQEILEKRSRTTKHFRNADGSVTA